MGFVLAHIVRRRVAYIYYYHHYNVLWIYYYFFYLFLIFKFFFARNLVQFQRLGRKIQLRTGKIVGRPVPFRRRVQARRRASKLNKITIRLISVTLLSFSKLISCFLTDRFEQLQSHRKRNNIPHHKARGRRGRVHCSKSVYSSFSTFSTRSIETEQNGIRRDCVSDRIRRIRLDGWYTYRSRFNRLVNTDYHFYFCYFNNVKIAIDRTHASQKPLTKLHVRVSKPLSLVICSRQMEKTPSRHSDDIQHEVSGPTVSDIQREQQRTCWKNLATRQRTTAVRHLGLHNIVQSQQRERWVSLQPRERPILNTPLSL